MSAETLSSRRPLAEQSRGARLVEAMGDIWAIAWRDLLRTARMPEQLTFSVSMGIFFLLLFNYVFGGVIAAGTGVDYIQFLVPGVLVITAVNGAQQTGAGLALDLSTGVVDRFRSLPMNQIAVIAGRTVADTARNTIGVLLVVVVGYVMGFRFESLAGAVATIALVVGLGYGFSWVGAWIGARIRNAETVAMLSMFWLLPLMLASSAFIPTAGMNQFVRIFAEYQPVSVVSNAARALSGGLPTDGWIAGSVAWIGGSDHRVRHPCGAGLSSSLMESKPTPQPPPARTDGSAWGQTLDRHRSRQADHIVSVAMGIIAAEGFGALSMSSLAGGAGVSRQTLYKYFADIDAVLTAMALMGRAGTVELAERTAAVPRPEDGIRMFVDAIMEAAAAGHPAPAALMAAVPPTARDGLRSHESRCREPGRGTAATWSTGRFLPLRSRPPPRRTHRLPSDPRHQ